MVDSPSSSLRWRWFHRIGYLCTFLILAEIGLVGIVTAKGWWRDRERRAYYREHSRVHHGNLFDNPAAININNDAISRLGVLASTTALGPNSVRLGVYPYLSKYTYALAMRRHGVMADGVVVVFMKRADGGENRTGYRFRAPAAKFGRVMAQFDTVTDGYSGGDQACSDGVHYAFERRRGSLTTSGTSMSSCDQNYERAADLLIEFVGRYVSLPMLRH